MVSLIKETLFYFFNLAYSLRLERNTEERIARHNSVIQVRQWLDLLQVLLIHHQRKPKSQFGYLDGSSVNVHAIEAVLNGMALEVVGCALANGVEVRRERGAGAHDLGHHAHRERAGAYSWIAHCNRSQRFVNCA